MRLTGEAAVVTTEERFMKIQAEAVRLHLDAAPIEVDVPDVDDEVGWLVALGAETDLPVSVSGRTLDEALDALIAALAELQFTTGGTES